MTTNDELIAEARQALIGSDAGTGLSKDFMLAAWSRTGVPALADALEAALAENARLRALVEDIAQVAVQRGQQLEDENKRLLAGYAETSHG